MGQPLECRVKWIEFSTSIFYTDLTYTFSDAIREYDVLLVDTHLFISTPRGKWPGISINNLQFLGIAQIIVVEASPHEILRRRMSDTSRYRDVVDEASLKEDIEYNRMLAATLSIYTSCPVAYIPNHEGEAEEAAKMLYEILSRMVKEVEYL